MKTFKYEAREYVPGVDLNILGKTFDTLEQGHKEAVKTASDLKVTLANIPLNEAENEWRQRKVNEIQQTIDDNTVFGNSYAALDDLILKSGNLMADQGMIGRIQAQKDFKEFETRVLNDNSLPQNYKEYFLEKNPYHYEDKYDDKGNLIGGTKWKPTVSPTNVIPINQLIAQAISLAAKEHGGGTTTRWLDANGKVTTNPMKAFDGEIFNSTTNEWDRLSKEKIWQAFKGLVNTTPGAAESIQQDYDVAVWEHNKAVKANNGKPIVGDITGSDGILLTPEQYLHKRVDPVAQAASYYNSTSRTTYGNGLKTYKAARARVEEAERKKSQGAQNVINSSTSTPIKIAVNPGQAFQSQRYNAIKVVQEGYKALTGRNLAINYTSLGDKNFGNVIINNLKKYGVSNQNIAQLTPYIRTYNNAVNNLHSIYNSLNPSEKERFSFNSRMSAGGQLIPTSKGGTKYDDQTIASINKLYGTGHRLVINIKDKDMQATLQSILGSDNFKRLNKEGTLIDDHHIIIPKQNMYHIPLIFNAVNKSYKDASRGFGGTLKDFFGGDLSYFTIQTYQNIGNNNYVEIDPSDSRRINDPSKYYKNRVPLDDGAYVRMNARNIFDNLVSTYQQGNNISNISKINPTYITVSNHNLTGTSHTSNYLLDLYRNGSITESEYKLQKANFDESFKNLIFNHDFSQSNLYVNEGGVLKKVFNSGERSNYGIEIKNSYRENKANFSPAFIPSDHGMIAGYNVTIADKEGKEKTFFVQGLIDESAADEILSDPNMQILNDIEITGGTKTTRTLSDYNYNPVLGDMSITGLGSDMFSVNFRNVNTNLNKQEATDLAIAVNNYDRAKTSILSNPSVMENKELRKTIAKSAITIGNLLNIDPNDIMNDMYYDLSSFYEQ